MTRMLTQLFLAVLLVGCSSIVNETGLQQASSTSSIPDELMEVIQLKTLSSDYFSSCGETAQGPLFSEQFVELDDNSLLLFLGLPDYSCFHSNSFIPVRIDPLGNWHWGETQIGAPSLWVQDEKHHFWLVSQWQVEGSFPLLYHSEDGLTWRPYSLPSERDVDCCFEFITEICTASQNLTLHFKGGSSGIQQTWQTGVEPETQRPEWQQASPSHGERGTCSSTTFPHGDWRRLEDATSYLFVHPSLLMNVRIPKQIRL